MQPQVYFGNPKSAAIYMSEEMGLALGLPPLDKVPSERDGMTAELELQCRVAVDWSPTTRELLLTKPTVGGQGTICKVRRNIGSGNWKEQKNVWVVAIGNRLQGLEPFSATTVPVAIQHNGLLVQLLPKGQMLPHTPRKKGRAAIITKPDVLTPAQRFSNARRELNAAMEELVASGAHAGFTFQWITGSEKLTVDPRGMLLTSRTVVEEL